MSLSFSNYVAATGTGQKAADARKNCNVRITLKYPSGWSYTVADTVLRGYAKVPATCTGTLGATYFFSGDSNSVCISSYVQILHKQYTVLIVCFRRSPKLPSGVPMIITLCAPLLSTPLFGPNATRRVRCSTSIRRRVWTARKMLSWVSTFRIPSSTSSGTCAGRSARCESNLLLSEWRACTLASKLGYK